MNGEVLAYAYRCSGCLKRTIVLWRIMDVKKAFPSLDQQDERLRLIYNSISIGLCLMDLDGRIDMANPYMCGLLEYDQRELSAKSCFELTHPNDVAATEKNLKRMLSGELSQLTFEKRFISKSGRTIWSTVMITLLRDNEGKPLIFFTQIHDKTQVKELENQLRRVQKTEAIATLAGGIAHDFNNILFAILGNAEYALQYEIKDNEPAEYSLRQIIRAANRAGFLIQQILTFSRRRPAEISKISLNPILKEIAKLLKTTLPANIEVRLKLGATYDTIMADPANIHQVVMNLCANAADAMEKNGGSLVIALEDVNTIKGPHKNECDSERCVMLSVADSGEGMTDQVRERIFDPYFTTKTATKGTGLGLAVVYGIVKDLNGAISVTSTLGSGSTFDVLLPVYIDDYEKEFQVSAKTADSGGEAILFVDDDEQIVEFMHRSLKALGYKVTAYSNSIKAFEQFRKDPHRFDLIISDMNMSGMTGEQLARKALKIRPEIPIIISTGYSELLTEESAHEIGIREVVMKPFMVNDIHAAVRRALTQK